MQTLELIDATYHHKSWSCSFSGTFHSDQWTIVCGPSGGGKSTLLQLIMGLIPIHDGNVLVDSSTIANIPPHLRGMGYMGQSNMLFPGITILENLFLTFHTSSLSIPSQREKIDEIVASLNLEQSILHRYPDQLSGGQLSRCNLARAALQAKQWLLLDEPFAALDRINRLAALSWLNKWRKDNNIGIIFVAHDLDEVLTVATAAAVVGHGTIIETNSINEIIHSPTRILSAQILGDGALFKNNQTTAFVSSQHLKTTRDQVEAPAESIECLVLSNPKTYRTGELLRIIDFEGDCDLTIPDNLNFSGTLWFCKDNCKALLP